MTAHAASRHVGDRLRKARAALLVVAVARQEILHLFSLLHALGLQCLRGDDNLDNLKMFDPFEGYKQSIGVAVVPHLAAPYRLPPPGPLSPCSQVVCT